MKHNPKNIPRSRDSAMKARGHGEKQVSWLMNIAKKTSHNVWHVRSCPLIIPARKNYQMQKAGAVAERVVYVRFGAHPGLSAVLFCAQTGHVALGPGCVKTPMLNLRVESPSRFRRSGEPIALASSLGRRQLRR
jgi:hypothetical protein